MIEKQRKSIAIASDHAGFEGKEALVLWLIESGWQIHDLGPNVSERCDYPDYAHTLGAFVRDGHAACGILICGSGIGMSIAVNRIPGVRGALVHSTETAMLARQHNDANVLCLGSRLHDQDALKSFVSAFLETGFDGGRHASRVAKIELEPAK